MKLNTIIQGDCLDVMKTMTTNSIDLVFTSPPYNLGNVKKNSFYANTSKPDTISYDVHNDDMSVDDYIKWQHSIIKELQRLVKSTGAIFYNHKPRILKGIYDDRRNLIPCNIRQEIIWQRSCGINFCGSFFVPTTERIFIIAGNDWKPNREFVKYGEVWKVSHENNTPHPAPFPLKLAKMVIESSSTDGQIILDPFAGSGTTCVAAELLNRKYIGIELSEDYCNITRKRIQEAEKISNQNTLEAFME